MKPIDRAEVERRVLDAAKRSDPLFRRHALGDCLAPGAALELALALLTEARAGERIKRDALLAALRDLIARTESEYPTDERAFVRARAAIRAAEGGEDAQG